MHTPSGTWARGWRCSWLSFQRIPYSVSSRNIAISRPDVGASSACGIPAKNSGPAAPAVLVVDDDSFMRAVLRRVFVAAGIPVETYASPADLLATADLQAHAVLLLDMAMPGMTGLELQALLQERGVHLPVIFLTGASDIVMAVAAMRNGAVDFLEKPFDKALLIGRVREALTQDAFSTTRRCNPHSDHARRLETLTTREREVVDLMIMGKTSKMMARELGGSFRTIEIHRGRIMGKMAAATLADLVRSAILHLPS